MHQASGSFTLENDYAPINVKPQEGGGGVVGQGVGILTFSEKMSQIPHPCDNIISQKKAPTLRREEVTRILPFRPCCTQSECNVCTTHLSCSHLSRTWEVHSNAFWVFSKMVELFSGNPVPRPFPSSPAEGKALGTRLISKPSSLSKIVVIKCNFSSPLFSVFRGLTSSEHSRNQNSDFR